MVPTLPALLNPVLPDMDAVARKEKEKRGRAAQQYNLRHRARDLDQLIPGQEVWITDQGASGAVISSHTAPDLQYQLIP